MPDIKGRIAPQQAKDIKKIIERFALDWPHKPLERLDKFGTWLLGLLPSIYSLSLFTGFGKFNLQPSKWLLASGVCMVFSITAIIMGKIPRGRIVSGRNAADIKRFYNEKIRSKSRFFLAAGLFFALGLFFLIPSMGESVKKAAHVTPHISNLELTYEATGVNKGNLNVNLDFIQLRERSKAEVSLVGSPTAGTGRTLFKQVTEVTKGAKHTVKLPKIDVANLRSFVLEVSLFEGKERYYHNQTTLNLDP